MTSFDLYRRGGVHAAASGYSGTQPFGAAGTAATGADAGLLNERDVLASLGEVVYEWSIPDDQLRWGPNAAQVLKIVNPTSIESGRRYAALLDPTTKESRFDTVIGSEACDPGGGVPYQIQYRLLPAGANGVHLWIEDTGRWFAGADGKPMTAHGTVRVINERYEREQRLAYLSNFDELTGQLNRTRFLELLDETIDEVKKFNISCAFIIVSIDNLRIINEAYGYDVADQVIALAAKRVKTRLRNGDLLGRYSGNKLGILLRDCDEREVEIAATRLFTAIREEVITTELGPVVTSATLGGVVIPRYAKNVHEAQVRASEALDQAKATHRGAFVAYRHSRQRDALRQSNIRLAEEVIAGLNEHRFSLAYQPIVNVSDKQPAFYECLLRMRRHDGTVLSAGGVIPIAERLGLVRLIDNRVLELALEDLAQSDDTRLSINVSGATAGDMDWLTRLTTGLRRNPTAASRIIIEIKETIALHDIDEACRFVSTLKDLGCQVAIDDFGAGYTSFRNLKLLDIDLVKIDGGYIEQLHASSEDQVFVRTLLELARTFDIKTVAECVEDTESAKMLADWGIDYLQGYLYGAAALEKPWLDQQGGQPAAVVG